MRISDWSSDVCSSDLEQIGFGLQIHHRPVEIGAKAHDVRRGDVLLRILRQRRGCTAEIRNEAEAAVHEVTVEQIGARAEGLDEGHQARRRLRFTPGDYTLHLQLDDLRNLLRTTDLPPRPSAPIFPTAVSRTDHDTT